MTYPGNDIEGWMSPEELQWLYTVSGVMKHVVEVGCWKGKSTHAILSSGCPIVVAVDHWNGSIDDKGDIEWAHKEATTQPILNEFLENVGDFKSLKVWNMTSLEAANSNSFVDGIPDMVFIDGGHTKAEAKADIEAWLPKCKKLLCGHDYDQAHIPEIAKELGLDVKVVAGTIWAVVI